MAILTESKQVDPKSGAQHVTLLGGTDFAPSDSNPTTKRHARHCTIQHIRCCSVNTSRFYLL